MQHTIESIKERMSALIREWHRLQDSGYIAESYEIGDELDRLVEIMAEVYKRSRCQAVVATRELSISQLGSEPGWIPLSLADDITVRNRFKGL